MDFKKEIVNTLIVQQEIISSFLDSINQDKFKSNYPDLYLVCTFFMSSVSKKINITLSDILLEDDKEKIKEVKVKNLIEFLEELLEYINVFSENYPYYLSLSKKDSYNKISSIEIIYYLILSLIENLKLKIYKVEEDEH